MFGSTLAVRKGDLKGFGMMFHAFVSTYWHTLALISISENCISYLEHVDCRPFDELLGSGRRLVIRDSEICQMA